VHGAKVWTVRVVYLTHEVFRRHDTGSWHPERPARLEAAERGVYSAGLVVETHEPPPADRKLLERVHTADYVDAIEAFCRAGGGHLDPDTVACPASWDAALRAAGAGPAAVELLRGSGDVTAFLAVRPPGHHALQARAMGFCLFNNVAVTAAALVADGERVAIVDWDVHHGNGTQATFADDENVLYVSLHQSPFYPGTGLVDEVGGPGAEGTVINVPVAAGTAGDLYRAAMERVVGPAVSAFAPDWLLISAGYDAHELDPLAEVRLVSADYGYMASRLAEVVPAARVVVFLEGGYHLPAITASVAETLRGLAGRWEPGPPAPEPSPPASWENLDVAARHVARYWGGG